MALATTRPLAKNPCIPCLIPKGSIHELGTSDDFDRHDELERIDDDIRRHQISSAREAIFERGLRIDSKGVKEVLEEGSYVPTVVSDSFNILIPQFTELGFRKLPIRMHSRKLYIT